MIDDTGSNDEVSLHWRHNGRDCVSNHQPHDCLLKRLFRQWKYQSSASLALVWGIHRRPVNSPHKWPVTRKMFSFDYVIMFHWVCMRTAIIKITVIWLFPTLYGSLHWACFANNDYLYKCLIGGMEINCIYINIWDAIIYPWPNSMQIILVKFAVYSHCLVYLGSGPLVST